MKRTLSVFVLLIGVFAVTGQQCTQSSTTTTNENSNAVPARNEPVEPTAPQKAAPAVENMDEADAPAADEEEQEVTTTMEEEMDAMEYQYEGILKDVTGNRGRGTAKAAYTDGAYALYAEAENVEDPPEGFFYEGWVVRKSPFNFISTGALEKEGDKWVNRYSSGTDYTDHTQYVLTIEPDDGDPAPAGHVLEGDMEAI